MTREARSRNSGSIASLGTETACASLRDAFKAPRRFRLEGDLESARQTLSTRIKVASKLTWERSTGGSRFGGDLKNHPRRLVTGFKAVCKPTWKRSRHDGRLQVEKSPPEGLERQMQDLGSQVGLKTGAGFQVDLKTTAGFQADLRTSSSFQADLRTSCRFQADLRTSCGFQADLKTFLWERVLVSTLKRSSSRLQNQKWF
ncbi:hypothetical protein PGTUg99_011386 [Puccinia graminis f. sp. tritici]|uniref:Uncharacterized protein n=1 Tax=Puccinia graminis f. sp. tritici TaxID=56615 RepID=A0A5B0SIZ6_PUCGR|nr:hypothetical protein PGTUg99_011386 [Puccinia graminis f. sp. tritici]